MTWRINETVRSGNATARVKNFYPETGFIVLHDIRGTIQAGMTIVGDSSGTSLTLSTFTISDEFEFGYEPTVTLLDDAIYDGNGNLVVTDDYFSSGASIYEISNYLIVAG